MPNERHVEPHPEHPDAPRDPEPDPEHGRDREDWGFDPVFTNTYRPGESVNVLHELARQGFDVPTDAGRDNEVKVRGLQKAAQRLQLLSERIRPTDATVAKSWEHYNETASVYRACLPDFWRDSVAIIRDRLTQIEDKKERQAAEKTFNDLFQIEGELLKRLAEWEALRREYPFDWDRLGDLQVKLNDHILTVLSGLKQIDSDHAMDSKQGEMAVAGQMFFSALAFELGRQAVELIESPRIEYGSACEAVAESLASGTGQNHQVSGLLDALGLQLGLSTKFASQPVVERWGKEVQAPLENSFKEWRRKVKGAANVDTAITLTRQVLTESFSARTALDSGEYKLPEHKRQEISDTLSLVSDAMVHRLDELREGADLQGQQDLEQLIGEAAILREATQVELLAKQAADQGLEDFWSASKKQLLDDIEKNVKDGKELKQALVDAFKDDLGAKLGKWADAVRKAPRHDPVAAHDAAWNLRFTIRRYRDAVKKQSKASDYLDYATRLRLSLDALQIAVSNRIRQAMADGYFLF